jgi:glycerol uptake operon antiterminator
MDESLFRVLEMNPIIAAVKDMQGLERCCQLPDIKIVFILFGDICSLQDITIKTKDAGKLAFIHVDLINGLSAKEIVVDYVAKNTRADGIISTRPQLIKRAQELGLKSIMRFFLLDSIALSNIPRQLDNVSPDCIEILPGLMPKIIRKVSKSVKVPVIAGGLIAEKEDVVHALDSGAISVSTTNPAVWTL